MRRNGGFETKTIGEKLAESMRQLTPALAGPSIDLSNYRFPAVEAAEYALAAASATVQILERQVRAFEAKLAAGEAIALWAIGGPAGALFFPTRIVALNPDKLVFEGHDAEGHPFTVIQHVSQLNFALQTMKIVGDEERQPIGFVIPNP